MLWMYCFWLLGCASPALRAPAAPLSVVMVSFDTTRADRIGTYGGPSGLTPNLDRFAEGAVVFEHAYAQTNTTGPSHASLFTSRYPTEVHGGGPVAAPGAETPLLAQVLHAYGYATAAFVSGGAMNPQGGLAPGFDVYKSASNFGSLSKTIPLALGWLEKLPPSKPSFTFVHGYDAHSPTSKPAPFAGKPPTGLAAEVLRTRSERVMDGAMHATDLDIPVIDSTFLRMRSPEARAALTALEPDAPQLTEADIARIRQSYDDALGWADTWFGMLMAGLEAQHRLENTVIIVLADHGEQLGEDGLFGHCCGAEDEETHVPLIIAGPGLKPRREAGIVELIDVLPTITDLVQAVTPTGAHGRSLAPALHGEPWEGREVAWTQATQRYTLVSGRTGTGRLSYTGVQAKSSALADLIEVARLDGPGFTSSGTVDRAALRTEMVSWLRSLSPAAAEKKLATPPELLRTMRSHGYFEANKP